MFTLAKFQDKEKNNMAKAWQTVWIDHFGKFQEEVKKINRYWTRKLDDPQYPLQMRTAALKYIAATREKHMNGMIFLLN